MGADVDSKRHQHPVLFLILNQIIFLVSIHKNYNFEKSIHRLKYNKMKKRLPPFILFFLLVINSKAQTCQAPVVSISSDGIILTVLRFLTLHQVLIIQTAHLQQVHGLCLKCNQTLETILG
jgi:hypothetical protein